MPASLTPIKRTPPSVFIIAAIVLTIANYDRAIHSARVLIDAQR